MPSRQSDYFVDFVAVEVVYLPVSDSEHRLLDLLVVKYWVVVHLIHLQLRARRLPFQLAVTADLLVPIELLWPFGLLNMMYFVRIPIYERSVLLKLDFGSLD